MSDTLTEVTVSERNLRSLLNKLERPDSARTLVKTEESGQTIILVAEHDGPHYAGREPGPVHEADDPGVNL